MGTRPKVALVFSYDPNWVGGTYYVQNLIELFKTIPINNQPIVTIISSKNDFEIIKKQGYPELFHFEEKKEHTASLLARIVNKAFRPIFKKNIIPLKYKYSYLSKNQAEVVFPLIYESSTLKHHLDPEIKRVYWIPDFQEKYLPEFFTEKMLAERLDFQTFISNKNTNLTFSSKSAKEDYFKFFPDNKTTNFVYNFSVFHQELTQEDFPEIKSKYTLPDKYFFCPNQFWQHKNHLCVFKALKLVVSKMPDIKIVFTGKENDSRNAEHFDSLKRYINDNELMQNVRFLGFIPRYDQLLILKNSIAVIQPSFFEGWSTVVEDVKAQNHYILLSELDVHKEQIQENVSFFNPNDEQQLADLLIKNWKQPPSIESYDYELQKKRSLEAFIDIYNNSI